MYAYLESIDRKLDALIELLSKKDNSFQSAYVDVTISGSGLKYCLRHESWTKAPTWSSASGCRLFPVAASGHLAG